MGSLLRFKKIKIYQKVREMKEAKRKKNIFIPQRLITYFLQLVFDSWLFDWLD